MNIHKRSTAVLMLTALLALAARAGAEVQHHVHLVDGSVLHGRVLSLTDQTLVLSTTYADSLIVPRSQVKAIVLADAPDLSAAIQDGGRPAAAAPSTAEATPALEGSGQLEVALMGDMPRSSARFRSPADRERMIQLNTLHFKLYVDDELALEDADSTTEKEYSDRGWTFLRNEHQFPPVSLTVPAGSHKVRLVVSNELDGLRQGEKQSQLLSADLLVEDVMVRPGEKSRIVIAGDGSRFKYGKYELKLLSQR